jgi:hypothetical protein
VLRSLHGMGKWLLNPSWGIQRVNCPRAVVHMRRPGLVHTVWCGHGEISLLAVAGARRECVHACSIVVEQ